MSNFPRMVFVMLWPIFRISVFFDLHLNQRLSVQSRRRWFETQSCSLWRQSNALKRYHTCHNYWIYDSCRKTWYRCSCNYGWKLGQKILAVNLAQRCAIFFILLAYIAMIYFCYLSRQVCLPCFMGDSGRELIKIETQLYVRWLWRWCGRMCVYCFIRLP